MWLHVPTCGHAWALGPPAQPGSAHSGSWARWASLVEGHVPTLTNSSKRGTPLWAVSTRYAVGGQDLTRGHLGGTIQS